MSRTKGFNLPRLPTSHARLTSPQSIEVHPGANYPAIKQHRRSISEPSYTAYLGSPRQDIPHHIYRDAALFDDVFEKQGKLFQSRDTPKITNPLNSLGYSSLHDPHCRRLFLNNKSLRSHLMDLGLITNDLKVVASTHQQRQKIRAHELLERKETLLYQLETQEQLRIQRLQKQPKQLPYKYLDSLLKAEERGKRADLVQKMKREKILQAHEQKKLVAEKKRLTEKKKMKQAIEEARLYEQAKRNAARYRQECAEVAAYEKQYGKFSHQLAVWRRDSDRIHNRMVMMKRTHWSKQRAQSPTQIKQADPKQQQMVLPLTKSSTSTTGNTPPPLETAEDKVGKGGSKAQDQSLSQESTDNIVTPDPAAVDDKEDPSVIITETDNKTIEQTQELKKHNDEAITTNNVNVDEAIEAIARVAIKDNVAEQLEESARTILDRDQSDALLTSILIEALQRVDYRGLGFVTVDDFTQLLNSRDLGLQLNENELLYIAEQVDSGNGWVHFSSVIPQLPAFIVALYNQRAEQQVQIYGAYMEDQWCQMYLPSGVIYYNKLNGEILTGGRPDDFRPYLKDDPFEESVVDFFETADTDKDGVVDINNVYSLLISPMVSTRIYNNQMEDLLRLFQENSESNLATLEPFAPIAKTLLMMIYQNAYPDVEEWIELDSRKFGTFLFNKDTGETSFPKLHKGKSEKSTFVGEDTSQITDAKSDKKTESNALMVPVTEPGGEPGTQSEPEQLEQGTTVPHHPEEEHGGAHEGDKPGQGQTSLGGQENGGENMERD